MKKVLVLSLMAVAVMALAVAPAMSDEGCSAAVKAEKASATAAAPCQMSQMTPAECAKLCGMTPEQCAQLCAGKENCGFTKISVKGMTCTGCEQAVEKALKDVPGVLRVVKVDYKEGVALVCTDNKVCQSTNLTKAIADKGYEASIVPAVAKTTDAPAPTMGACPATCPHAASKTCATPCTKGAKTETKVEPDKKTEGSH